MGEHTEIAWTDATYNPWWGCERVSPACDHCYAESTAKRYGHDVWGEDSPRRFFPDKHWAEPLKWDRKAAATGVPMRVFCASMADVFEDRRDLDAPRARLFELIESTPNLRWQLLTKRPQHIGRLIPARWGEGTPSNVWLGTTAEDQPHANVRVRQLISKAYGLAPVLFVSYEPALGPVKFGGWANMGGWLGQLDWIICGGESGAGARPMEPQWARNVRDECAWAGVPFFFKQWGQHAPADIERRSNAVVRWRSKKDAGSLLDGVSHKACPDLGDVVPVSA